MNFLGLLNANAQFNQPQPENLNDQLSNTNSDFSPKIKKAVIVRGVTFSYSSMKN
ncbi:hypothetical protein [Nostoc sp.]|uniref:hypothetical protein n=1 Tax=Nostoc sp. TaxID=1180 RepID=UPI002FFCEF71